MILAKKYNTLEGVIKRCDFENAHQTRGNINMTYRPVWFLDGVCVAPSRVTRDHLVDRRVHWQMEKVKL